MLNTTDLKTGIYFIQVVVEEEYGILKVVKQWTLITLKKAYTIPQHHKDRIYSLLKWANQPKYFILKFYIVVTKNIAMKQSFI